MRRRKPRRKKLYEIESLVAKALNWETLSRMCDRVDEYVLRDWMTQTGAEKVCRWIVERAEVIRMGVDQRDKEFPYETRP
jgi:hypothetical protein